MVGTLKLGVAVGVISLLAACDGGGYGRGGYGGGYSGGYGGGYGDGYGRSGAYSQPYQARGCRDGMRCDRDDNPPGPRGGPGTNWENPPGPAGGPGASPDRRDWRR